MRSFVLWNKKKDDYYCVDAYDSMDALHRTKDFYEQLGPIFGEFELECIAEVPPIRINTSLNDRVVRVSMGMRDSPAYRDRIFYGDDSVAELAGFVKELEDEQLRIAKKARDMERRKKEAE